MRRALRIIVLLVLLAALAGGAAEVVRRSDLPRRLAEQQLRDQLGLPVALGRVEVGWGGVTRIENLTLGPPLGEAPLLGAPAVTIEHSALPWLLIGAFEIKGVTAKGALVHLIESPTGTWNAGEVIRQVAAVNAGARNDGPAGTIALPRLSLTETTVRLTDADGATQELTPATLRGTPGEGGRWEFSVRAGEPTPPEGEEAGRPAPVTMDGQIHPGGAWPHQLSLSVRRGDETPVLRHWLRRAHRPVTLRCAWSGQRSGAGLTGRAEIEKLRIGVYEGAGPVRLDLGPSGLELRPRGLTVSRGSSAEDDAKGDVVRSVTLQDGRVSMEASALVAEQLEAQTARLEGRLNGRWNWGTRDARLEVHWTGHPDAEAPPEAAMHHTGRAELTYHRPTAGRHVINAEMQTEGRSAQWGRWNATGRFSASNAGPERWDWSAHIQQGAWRRSPQQRIDLAGLHLAGETAWPLLTLTEASLPNAASSRANARANFETGQWEASAELTRWSPPLWPGGAVDLTASARGEGPDAQIETFEVHSEQSTLSAHGTYKPERTDPLQLDATARWTNLPGGAAAMSIASADAASNAEDDPSTPSGAPAEPDGPPPAGTTNGADASSGGRSWAGRLEWAGTVRGALRPVALVAEGTLEGRRLVANGRSIEDVDVATRGTVTAERITVDTEPFEVLGGRCSVRTEYRIDRRDAELSLGLERIEIGRGMTLINPELKITGTAGAELKVTLPDLDPNRLDVAGSWQASQVRAEPLRVERASGRLRTRGRVLRLDPIELHKGDGEAKGRVRFDLRDGRTLHATLRGDRWPIELERSNLRAVLSGSADVDVDVIDRTLNGSLDLNGRISQADATLGEFAMRGAISEQALTVETLQADAMGGTVRGGGRWALDSWLNSEAKLKLTGLSADRLEEWAGLDLGAEGALDGRVELKPADDEPRAPEPLRIGVTVEPRELVVRGAAVTAARFTFYAGPRRYVLHESQIDVAGGRAQLWASASHRVGQWYGQARVKLEQLSLQTVRRMIDPEAAEAPGRLSGRFSIVGPFERWRALDGTAQVQLEESDLGRSPIIGAVFDAMRLNMGDEQPTGEGQLDLRLDRGGLRIDRFAYLNRGVEVYGSGELTDLGRGLDCPINMAVVGTARPLRNLPLPGSGEMDRLFKSLQPTLTTVRVDGTLGEPKTRLVPFAETSAALRRLLQGQSDGSGN